MMCAHEKGRAATAGAPIPRNLDFCSDSGLSRHHAAQRLSRPIRTELGHASPGLGRAFVYQRRPAASRRSDCLAYRRRYFGMRLLGHGQSLRLNEAENG